MNTSAQEENKPGRMTEMGGRQLALKGHKTRKNSKKDPSLTSASPSILGYSSSNTSHLSVVSNKSIKS